MSRAKHHNGSALLMVPALAMLALGFLIPLVLFFARTMFIDSDPALLPARIAAIALSDATLSAIVTTNWIALIVTSCVLLASYPIAYILAHSSRLRFSLIIFTIIVPYFTSVIVRTYAWMVLLGRKGVINNVLIDLGIIEDPLPLLYNKSAIIIGMAYVLLPYMILTLFATMKAIDPTYVRAARGLGASASYTFLRIYFPMTLHGVLSGSLIVFILAIGFFITPALMGGPSDVMIAMLIERAVEINVDWPAASILSLLLLGVTLVLYAIYFKITDVRRLVGG